MNAESISDFQRRQRAAFATEREDWKAKGLHSFEEPDLPPPPPEDALPPGARAISAPVQGSVWQVLKAAGETVEAGETIMIVELMKMEVRVCALAAGRITNSAAAPGQVVRAGQRLGVIVTE